MRIHASLLVIGMAAGLMSCGQSGPGSSGPQADRSRPEDTNAADVAWATGWHIWKLQCPSLDVKGVQVVVLDENDDVVLGGGATLAVNHTPGRTSVLRVALEIDGKSVQGRMSANGLSTDFDYPDAFKERHTATYHEPIQRENIYVLAEESARKTVAGAIVRRVALRLVTDVGEGS